MFRTAGTGPDGVSVRVAGHSGEVSRGAKRDIVVQVVGQLQWLNHRDTMDGWMFVMETIKTLLGRKL